MKNISKKHLLWVSLTTVLIGLTVFSGIMKARALDGAFDAMYDSNAIFLKQAGGLLQRENDITNGEGGALDVRQLLDAIKSDRQDILLDIDISDIGREMLIQLYEENLADRFIVKYKENSNRRSMQDVPGIFVLEAASVSSKANVPGNILKGSNCELLECIQINEKVNPAELAATLKAAGMAADIEYIQPDFQLSLDDLSLSVRTLGEDVAQEDDLALAGQKEVTAPNQITLTDDPPEEIAEQEELIKEEPAEDGSQEEDLEEEEEPEEEEAIQPIIPSQSVLIAIIDTGLDTGHEIFEGYLSEDAPDSATDLLSYAHGTHVGGIVVSTVRDTGADVKILPIRVFDNGNAYTSDIIAAIWYASSCGARIINCSFGSTAYNQALYEAIEESGALFLCAAGNNRRDFDEIPSYPAGYDLPNVVSITSVNFDEGFSYYSNYGCNNIDIAARGRDVYSSLPGNTYGKMSGTSMSTAYVTGAAAAILSAEDMSASELKYRMTISADKLSNLLNKVKDGNRVNLDNALAGADGAVLTVNPADDFDVHGYQPTQSELYELYSASGKAVQVAACNNFSLVLMENGTVWACGDNMQGQCGNGGSGFYAKETTFVQVIGLTEIVAIAVGDRHCLALKADGTAWAWGNNTYGQLGDLSTTLRTVPVQVSGLTGATAITAGQFHSLALKANGNVWAWGSNSFGQLGDGTTTNQTAPLQVNGLTNAIAIAAGDSHSLALKLGGSVWSWGNNLSGQFGDGTNTPSVALVQASGLTGVTDIASRYQHSIALKSDGTVWAWGYNSLGVFGDGTSNSSTTPVQADGLTGVTAITTGQYNSLAVKANGSAWAWGNNTNGQVGDGTTTDRKTPVQVSGLSGVIDVASGVSHSLAVLADGSVWSWGLNNYGQLGKDGINSSYLPIKVMENSGSVSFPGQITIDAEAGKKYDINISANGISSFNGMTIIFQYDTAVFSLIDLCAFTRNEELTTGAIIAAGINITQVSAGEIRLTVDKTIPPDKLWAGTVNVIRLKAKATAQSVITVAQ